MTVATAEQAEPRPKRHAWRRWSIMASIAVLIGAFANLLGWDIRGWLDEVWATMKGIPLRSLIFALCCLFVQTTATAFAWFSILRFAFPERVRWRDIWTGYAVAVGLNTILPANLGTLIMLIMFSALVGTTFASILGAYAVEKIFFTVAGAFVYLYLFLTVSGSFDIEFAFVHERPWATAALLASGIYLLVAVIRRLWTRVKGWWQQAKAGGAILSRPRTYMLRVFLPSFVAWCAMLAYNGTLMHAYGIPVSFDTLMHLVGGNSLANVTAVTPGGAGVTQAFAVTSLRGVADPVDATAFSVTAQVLGTAWALSFAAVLMIWSWGWTGGKALVRHSYDDARQREEEARRARRERKAEKAAAEARESAQ